jgi:hypothetical protein
MEGFTSEIESIPVSYDMAICGHEVREMKKVRRIL